MKLSDYIKGLRKGKEAHRLEKESMQDPFLADAMDGYQQVEGNHEHRLEQLRRQVSARTSKVRFRRAVSWSVAACLALGVGISSYFLFMKGEEAMPSVLFEEEVLAAAPSEDDTLRNSDTTNIRNISDVTNAPTAEIKKTTSKVLAQTKHVQQAPAAVVEIEETMMEDAEEVAADTDITVVTMDTKEPVAVMMASPAETSKQIVIAGKNLVKGKVVDEHNEPMIGAVVSVIGTNFATFTNAKGQFELKIPQNSAELRAEFIGYEPVVLSVDTGNNMLIAMREDPQKLEETTIVANGATRRNKKGSSAAAHAIANEYRVPRPLIGKSAYKKYLQDSLIHPSDETCKDLKGIVTLAFYIDKDGNPERITIVKGLCKSADQEAVRLVKEGPKWTQGKLPVELDIKF